MSPYPSMIAKIIELSGPMPDAQAHCRFLESLKEQALAERLAMLQRDQERRATRRWNGRGLEVLHA